MILIDTSVWVHFFKGLEEAKFAGEKTREKAVLLHPFVLGELLLGGLSAENESLLRALPIIAFPPPDKIWRYIKKNSLPGKGIGWVDSSILYSALEEGAALATFDEALQSCAYLLGVPCVPVSEAD